MSPCYHEVVLEDGHRYDLRAALLVHEPIEVVRITPGQESWRRKAYGNFSDMVDRFMDGSGSWLG